MDCTKKKNADQCSCTYLTCDKRGACCQCVAFHRSRGEMVGCYFKPEVEKTWDRSMERFLSQFH